MKTFFAVVCLLAAIPAWAVDLNEIANALKSKDGLVAEIHGADADHKMFVLVWRNKNNFFDYVQLPMYGKTKAAQDVISKLHRHDFVRVKGEFDPWINTAQRHINVTSIEMVKQFDPGYDNLPEYHHEVKLPSDIEGKSEIVVKVHAVTDNGQVMMVEYKDTNIPVIVQEPDRVKNLYRGDKIKIQYTMKHVPNAPTHILLNKGDKAVEMLSSIAAQNGKPLSLCGPLVLYVESPQIMFNVFALESDIGDGLAWTYTLMNVDNKIFAALRKKMQTEWDSHAATVVRGRNYFINPQVKVCVRGTGNEVDPTQANPQIFINSVNDLWFQ